MTEPIDVEAVRGREGPDGTSNPLTAMGTPNQWPGDEVVHMAPPTNAGVMPCCGRPPFELPRTDRLTEDPTLVTCRLVRRERGSSTTEMSHE